MSNEETDTKIIEAGQPRLISCNDGLQALKIGKRYRKRPVLREVSITLKRGEVVGLLGPNGAGKTTCFYIFTGLIASDYGSIVLDGQDVTNLPMYPCAFGDRLFAPGSVDLQGYDGRKQHTCRA